ncbi:BadF/BadG/BcrA/BcrD ATPase family protein [Alicyclobacillus kakegawensis]|uniref:BadF/BadG/BcrA/BcrD ATPase family protein n=1 Tax=Alicyclobacillus kakegawensis TaxID=392012 RepID=UPI0008330E8C|nr:BadF/BadG/BcrA/BcrD ATPase family protein [Alicyclobacillus kakegawensis]
MAIFVGVDGGGSKTEVMAVDTHTSVVATAVGAGCNPQGVGLDRSLSELSRLVDATLCQVGEHYPAKVKPDAVSFALAGVDRPQQAERIRAAMQEQLEPAKLEVVNDGLAALAAGTEGQPGTVLIAGTGSIALGETADGTVVRAGGFGSLIGDEGSGFDIGRKGLMAAIQAFEERGPKTILWDMAQRWFHVREASDLISRVYESTQPVAAVAAFARVVLEAAHVHADPVAQAITDTAVVDHQHLIEAVWQKLPPDTPRNVVLAGSLFTRSDVLRERLVRLLPGGVVCSVLRRAPAAGSILRAIRLWQAASEGSDAAVRGQADIARRLALTAQQRDV